MAATVGGKDFAGILEERWWWAGQVGDGMPF